MAQTIDYYFSLNSPWTYLGHQRFMKLARRYDAAVNARPVNFAIIFAATGGLPVNQRPPARQAYRLMELERWRETLDVPLNIHPAHWPANETLAAGMVLALRERGDDCLAFAGAVMRAVWAEDRDISAPETLFDIASALALDGKALMATVAGGTYEAIRKLESEEAVTRGVFGAPTYILGEALFWGQDRLDFLERALQRASATHSTADMSRTSSS